MPKPPFARRPLLEELEPRLLFSADLAPLLADAFAPQAEMRVIGSDGEFATTPDSQLQAAHARFEVVFIDTQVQGYEQFLADIHAQNTDGRSIEVVLLDADRDGVTQIGDFLSQRQDIDAVHIISHGSAGTVELGAGQLNFDSLVKNATAIKQWGNALTSEADILIYGCDLASTQDGVSLVNALSTLTGADVAASDNKTGNAALGGDWNLEYRIGQIETGVAVSEAGQQSWTGLLALSPQGAETRVNIGTTGNQEMTPNGGNVAMDANGNYVIVFSDYNVTSGDVYAQRYNAAGVAQGTAFRVNSTTSDVQDWPAVAMDPNGNFVVAWNSNAQDGSGWGIYAQRFNAAGVAQGSEFRVNTSTTGNQEAVSIGMADDGSFAVAFTDYNANAGDIYIQRYNASGVAQGGNALANTTTSLIQAFPEIAVNGSGDFVVVWESQNQDPGASYGIYGQRYNASGVAQGSEFRANTTTAGEQKRPSVSIDSSGNFIVAWASATQDTGGDSGIYAQRFNAAGVAQGSEFRVNTTTAGDQTIATVRMRADGQFIVSWVSNGQDVASTLGVYAQAYDAAGVAQGGEFRVNTTTAGDQTNPAVAYRGDYAVIAWNGNGTGDSAGVFMQRYFVAANLAPVNTAPIGQYTAYNTSLVFSSGNGNQISISDADAASNPVQVTLSVASGTLTLAGMAGLTITGGANGSASMTFTGTLANINLALNGLTYTSTVNFRGLDQLQIVTNDLGNSGSGGALADSDTVNLYVGAMVVTNTNDTSNGNTASVSALAASNGGDGISLREAILATNNTGGTDYIYFNIAGAGVQTINVGAAGLPIITSTVIIDGWSSPNYAGTPIIEINGASATGSKGLELGAGSSGSTIRGLIVNRFSGTGIEISGSNNHTIQGNWIGLNSTGTAAAANGVKGIFAQNSTGNLIGGTTAAERNVISGNAEQGIYFDNTDSSTISGNYIGTNAAGTGDVTGTTSNTAQTGVFLTNGSSGNVIGGTTAGARNVISGNNHYGVEILGLTSQNNLVQGNYIGTDATGLAALGNTNGGMSFWGAGTGNVLGGGAAGAGNVISGNSGIGVLVGSASVGATIQGNYIGVGADGVTKVGNGTTGVNVEGGSTNTRVGTDANGTNDAAERNVISGNADFGVLITGTGTTGTLVKGNYIGTDSTGTVDVGNGTDGVALQSGTTANVIGGTTAAEAGNVLSGNGDNGVGISDAGTSNNVVQGNTIGLNQAQTVTVGNFNQGVWIGSGATNNTVGGTTVAAANIITGATYAGIEVNGASSTGNVLLGNRVYGNGTLGIDLIGANGVNANDAGDADTGANNLQNFPVLSSASTTGSTITIQGTLNSTASSYYRVEFFANTLADGTGYGEGQRHLGFLNVATDGSGNATISVSLTATVAAGEFVSATATKSNATYTTFTDTSEFALNVVATVPNTAPVNSVPGAQSTNEDTAKVFSSGNGNQISITDVDAGGANNQVTISVTNGTLTLSGITGLSFTAGDGTADATMTFRGTAAAINTALNGLSFSPTANYNGGATLTLATKDAVLLSLDIDTGLLGRYAFENTGALGTDTSPAAGYTGTVSGVTAVVDGTRGNVLSLAGAGYVQTTGHFGNPANVTLAAWVNLTTPDTFGSEVISLGDSVALRLDISGKLVGFMYDGSSWTNTEYVVSLAGTGWHHVAYSFNDTGNTATLYLDGTAVATSNITGSISYTQGANSFIGTHGNGGTIYDFTGRIDDARIYNRALTATEIYTLANDLSMTDTDTVAITVAAVNDAPTQTAGTVANLTALEDSGLTSLGFGGVAYGPGGGADESGQTLSYAVTALPSGSIGNVFLADGTTLVTLSSYTLAEIQGMQFKPTANANGVTGFQFNVTDSGGTANGGSDSVSEFVLITVSAVNDAPVAADDRLALNFDGVDDYVSVSTSASLVMGSAMTMEAWINPDISTNATQIILNKEGEYEMAIFADGSLNVAFAEGGTWAWHSTGAVIDRNAWTHVAVTYNAGAVTTYVNGVSVNTQSMATATIDDTYPAMNELRIGGRMNNPAGQYFDGRISEVRVWNVVRSQAEIAGAMNIGLIGNETGLAGYWKLDENTGATAVDSTANVNTGTLVNGPAWAGYRINEDMVLNVAAAGVLTNDYDADGNPITAVLVSGPSHAASFTLNADGSFSYTPTANWNGTDSFTYKVNDGMTDGNVATATITVNPVNDAPTASNLSAAETYTEDTAKNLTDIVISDVDSATVTATLTLSNAAAGSLNTGTSGAVTSTFVGGVWTASGAIADVNALLAGLTFTPAANYNGSFSIATSVSDGVAAPITGSKAMTGAAAADTPSVTNASTNEDTQSTSGLVITRNAADGAEVGWFKITGITNGTLYQNDGVTAIGNGSFITVAQGNAGLKFTPTANFNGSGSFTVQASTSNVDAGLGGSTVNATITVTAVNDAPAGADKTVTTLEDTAYTFTTADFGFTDPIDAASTAGANALLNVKISTLPAVGSLTWFNGVADVAVTLGQSISAADITAGRLKFTPAANANGNSYASFTFQVQDNGGIANGGVDLDQSPNTIMVNVIPVNDAPVATDDSVSGNEDTTISGNVLGNDSDIDSGSLTAAVVSAPTFGTLTLNADGSFSYTPNADWNGTDSFTYRANDGTTDSNVATATITVNPVNDAPVRTAGTVANLTALEDSGFTSLGFAGVSYSPGGGADESGQTLSYTVTAIPSGSIGNVYLADGTTLVTTGSYTLAEIQGMQFKTTANASGVTGFQYNITDSGGTANGGLNSISEFVLITITAVNDAPAGADKTISVLEDGTYLFAAADFGFADPNDSPANALLAVKISTLPVAGSLTWFNGVADVAVTLGQSISAADITAGRLKFTPATNANGAGYASFTFQVQDNGGITNGGVDLDLTANTITIDVTPVTDLAATDDSFTGAEDTQLNGDVSLNDSTSSGGVLSYALATNVSNGSLTLNTDGSFSYTGNANWHGADSFSYTVTDAASGESSTQTVSLTITPVTDLAATDDSFTGAEDTQLNGDVSLNDSTSSGGVLTYALATAAANGTVLVNANGSFSYTGNANWHGTDSFSYTVTDAASGESSTQTVSLTITPVTDLAATDDSFTGAEDTLLNGDVSLNDSTSSGGVLTYALATNVSNGSLTLNTDGSFSYTGNANWHGTDSFSYTVTDAASGESSTQTVSLTITPVTDLAAQDDSFTGAEDTLLNGDVSLNDSTSSGGVLTYALATAAANGTVLVNANGSFSYTGNANWHGADSFSYTVTDAASGESSTQTVSLTITPVTDLAAQDDSFTGAEDTLLNGDVSLNDSTSSGGVLTYALATNVSNGSLTLNTDGSFSYTGNANWHGTDSFSYTVTDAASGESSTQTVTLTITPVTDLAATDDSFTGAEDTLLNGDVSLNDSTSSGGVLSYALATAAANGTVLVNANGSFSYTGNANWHGTDSFSYTVTDAASGESSTQTVSLTITPVTDLAATDDSFTGAEDTLLNGDVSLNDSTSSGGVLTYALATAAANGTVLVNTNGSFSYTGNANWHGTDSFSYTVTDAASGESSTQTVSLTITPVTDLAATDDSFTGAEDTLLNGDVSLNDSTSSGGVLSYALATAAANGSLTLNTDGSFSYTGNANWHGTDSFSYTVTDAASGESSTQTVSLTITPVTDLAATDDSFTGAEDTLLNGDVSLNDSTSSGGVLSYALATAAANGTVLVNANGSFSYTGNANWHGTDSFSYTVTDAASGESSTQTVSLTITPVTDLAATDDSFTGAEDTLLNGDVSLNDSTSSGGVLSYALATAAANGTVLVNANGSFSYTGNANWHGTDSFSYTVTDAASGESSTQTVSLTITPVTDLAATDDSFTGAEDTLLNGDVSLNDSTSSGGVLTYALATNVSNGTLMVNTNGSFSYTGNANWHGTDSFSYTVTDAASGESSTQTVSLTITPVTDLAAQDDSFTGAEDTLLNGDVSLNDSTSSGGVLSYALATAAANGTVLVNANGSFSYTGNANWHGTDSFSYTVTDAASGESSTQTVSLTITPVTDLAAQDDSFTGAEDTLLNGDVSLNDSTSSGGVLSYALATAAANGTVLVNANGSFSYTGNANWHGTDSFSYTVTDAASGESSTQTVSLTITPVTDLAATDDSFTGAEDTLLNGDVSLNDSTSSGGVLSYALATNVSNGSLTLNTDGSFSYTGNANWHGTDSFSYTVTDAASGESSTQTVSLTITPVTDLAAQDDSFTGAEDTLLNGDVSLNDSTSSGGVLTYALATNVSNGSLTLNTDGSFSYTGNANWHGADSFSYTVTDAASGESSTQTVSLTITPVTDLAAQDDSFTGAEDTLLNGDVSLNDSTSSGGVLTYALATNVSNGSLTLNTDGSFSYTGNANWHGADSFSYTVTDAASGESDTRTVTLTITPVNDAPSTTPVTLVAMAEDSGARLITQAELLANASDVDGPSLTATNLAISSGLGSLTDNLDGTWTYTPAAYDDTAVSFSYTVTDGSLTAAGTASLDITAGNDTVVIDPVDDPPVPPVDPVEVTPIPTTPPADGPSEGPAETPPAISAFLPAGSTDGNPATIAAALEVNSGFAAGFAANSTDGQYLREGLSNPETQGDILLHILDYLQVNYSTTRTGDGTAAQLIQVKILQEEGFRAEILSRGAQVAALSLSVGAVWWALSAGSLFASALTSLPAWRSIDVLPVLRRSAEDEEDGADGADGEDGEDGGHDPFDFRREPEGKDDDLSRKGTRT